MATQNIRRIIEIDVKTSAASAAAVREMQRNLKELEKTAGGVKGALGGLAGIRIGAFGVIKQGILELISTIKDLSGVGFAQQVLEIQSALERLRLGFSTIDDRGLAGAADTIVYLRKISKDLGLDFDKLSQAFLQMSAAAKGTSLEGDKTREIFEGMSLAARNLGLSSEKTEKAFLALQQMISKGVVQQEELRGQLSEALPGAVGIFARALGISTAKLNDMIFTGKALAEDVLPKVAAQMKKEFGKELPEGINKATVALNDFKNSYTQLQQAITDAGAAELAAKTLNSYSGLFERLAKSIDDAKDSSTDLFDNLSKSLPEFFKREGSARDEARVADLERLLAAKSNSIPARRSPFSILVPNLTDSEARAEIANLKQLIALEKERRSAQNVPKAAQPFGGFMESEGKAISADITAGINKRERAITDLLKRYKLKEDVEKQDLATAKMLLDAGDLLPATYARIVEEIKKKNKVTSEGQQIAERELEQAKRLEESAREGLAIQRSLGYEYGASKNFLKTLVELEEEYNKATTEAARTHIAYAAAIRGEEEAERQLAVIRIAVLAADKQAEQIAEKRIQSLYEEAEATKAEIETIGSTKEQIRQKNIALKELQITELELLRTEAMRGKESPATIARYSEEIAAIQEVIDAKRRLTSKELFGGGFDTSEFDAKKIKETEEQQRVFSQSLIDNFKRSKNLGKAVVESIKDELDRRVFKMFVEPQVDFLVKQLDKILNSFAEGLKKIIDEYLSTVNGGDGGFVSFLAKLISTGLGGSGSSTGGSQLNYSSDYGNNPSAYVGPSSATSTETRRRASSAPVYSAVTAFAGPTMQGAGNMGGLTVNIINAPEGTTATERQTPNGRILDVIIAQAKDAVAGDITSGGKVGNAIQTTYGISRNTPRVGF